ncbi:retrovirus-related pol polyprotein from transposon TNT 1-94, partial [Tanacetum coccineum]
MHLELKALEANQTWTITDLPAGKIPIGSKWVYMVKCKADGTIDKYKARLVANGHTQKEGIDFHEIFALVVKMVTVRALIAIVVHNSWPITQLDINNVSLHGDLSEEINIKTLVGKLLYLTITRPDIYFAVQTLSHFIQAPRTPHLKALIKVLSKQLCPEVQLRAEYKALADVTCELSWIKCLFKDLGIMVSSPINIYCGNASAIALASNLHQLADVLTKGLSKAPHYHCLS